MKSDRHSRIAYGVYVDSIEKKGSTLGIGKVEAGVQGNWYM